MAQIEAGLHFIAQRAQLGQAAALDAQFEGFGLGRIALAPAVALLLKTQAQGVVLLQHGLQGSVEALWLQRLACTEQHGLVPVMTIVHRLGEEPMLDRRQRDVALTVDDAARRLGAAGCDLGQLGDALTLEQLPWRQLDALTAGTGNDLQAENGVATQLEEVVVTPYSFHAQQLLPDVCELAFQAGARRLVVTLDALRFRQRLALQLAIGRQRQTFERDEVARHHELGQALFQPRPQLDLVVIATDHIGHQLLVAHQHHRFA